MPSTAKPTPAASANKPGLGLYLDEPYDRETVIEHTQILADSFRRLLGRPLVDEADNLSPVDLAKYVWNAPLVLLSHNNAPDPTFSYANRKAQELFGYTWEEFIRLPSRLSAEPIAQGDRERLLREARDRGYIDNYHGIRIAKDGSRFRIENVILWNITDDPGNLIGQAAIFKHWRLLNSPDQSLSKRQEKQVQTQSGD